MTQQNLPAQNDEPGPWQLIETCPRNGFFLVHEDEAIRTMMRVDGVWSHPGIPVMITEFGDRITSSETERTYGRKLEILDFIYEPTHWMSLPAPPTLATASKER